MPTVEEPVESAAEPEALTAAAASAAAQATLVAAPELVAESLPEYVRAWVLRLRAGESGVLPVVGGLILISILFQSLNSHFLTAGNLVNLLLQGAPVMLLAMAEIFVLLLGEIDLSIGFVGAIGGTVMAELVKESTGWPWWAAVIMALIACAGLGLLQGTIITRLGLPSFVVTLAGLLGFQGVLLQILGKGGAVPINVNIINDLDSTSGTLTPVASWIVMVAAVAVFGALAWRRDARRRASGLVAPPASFTLAKIVTVLVAGVVVVAICNTNRGVRIAIRGVPWAVLIVLGVLAAWTFLLGRTRFGRYVYAIGGTAEAARRAGIGLARIRTLCFVLAGFTAALAGMLDASRLRSVSTAIDGGKLVLYAVAAAVIGGTSLFGGRGKALHAVLGGLVIAAIANGMGLQGYGAPAQLIVTALVLLAAVTIDALTRRGRTAR
jgi:D-xylose transport system permease protein